MEQMIYEAPTPQAYSPEVAEQLRSECGESHPVAVIPTAVYTVIEVSRLMRTDRGRIYAYIESGALRAFKLGTHDRRHLILGSEVISLINRLARKGA